MEHSAGIAIIYKNKILLVKPANAKWFGTYGIPKGWVENGESVIDAAIRETKEEIGILIPKEILSDECVLYYEKNNIPYKKISYFYAQIQNLSEIGLDSEILPKSMLQIEEVEWAGFLDIKEASHRIFLRQNKILDMLM